MPKAYSYLRFSTPDQMRGDSFRRQSTLARDYAAKHGLELDETLTFHDLGVSAFRGRNAEAGRLADFLEAVKAGLVERGSYLLVESLDRISRQAARKALRVLESIVDEGVTVVTLSDGRAYDADTLNDDPMSLMLALMIFIRSNEESAMKARRLKAAWEGKRAEAASKVVTARAPAWLELTPERTWKVREERAAVVRRIFDMAAEGKGQNLISATLNREGVPTFGDSTRTPGRHWHRTYVIRLLRNPAVVGTFIPHVVEHEEGKRKRVAQKPIEGYYPAIVERDVYERVQALAMDTCSPLRGRHATQGTIRNLLGGMAVCPLCHGSMTRVSKGSRAKAGKPYLVCTRAKAGAGCTYHAVRMEDVERRLRESAGYIAATVPAPDGDSDIQDKIRSVETTIEVLEEELGNLLDALSKNPSPAISQRVRETEAAIEEMREEQSALWERVSATHGPLLEQRIDRLLTALEADEFDVGQANVALRQVLSGVVVNYLTGELELNWLHGGTSYLMFAWPTVSQEPEVA
jgi:Site-specific recombinases, DNA invertase Pin homologs